MPPCAEYFIGVVDGELACHVAVAPFFTSNGYRATRLVTMPEWQGAGVGVRFLEWIAQYHLEGNGRCNRKYPTYFHTSHPKSRIKHNGEMTGCGSGYGGHFRAVQGFKYIGG